MQTETVLPDQFTLYSDLGVFMMSTSGEERVYDGEANGFGINITVMTKKRNLHYEATLYTDDDRWGFATQDISGDFSCLEDLTAMVSAWVDHLCAEQIEDYAKDVQYCQTKDGKLAYWAYNTHLDGCPLVFVHGGPGGDSNPVKARRLHLDHPVYLFDQMGCGMSDPIRDIDHWKLEDYISEMDEFIEGIPSEKVILVGASWGAGLSVAYADATGCRKVAGLVLPSPFLSASNWTEDAMQNLRDMGGDYYVRMRRCLEEQDYGEEFTEILGEYNARYLFNRPCFREYAVAAAEEVPNEVFRKLCGPNDLVTDGFLRGFDVTGALSSLTVPVMFMCADSDEVTIPRIVQYHSMVKGSRLSVIPHAGHVLALEQFAGYRAAIRSFLEENRFD